MHRTKFIVSLSLPLIINSVVAIFPVVGRTGGGTISIKAVIPPTIEIFEIKRQNVETFSYRENGDRLVNTRRNSELWFGEDTAQDSALLLKCRAPYAVQWIFHGDSHPEFNTNTSRTDYQDGDMFNAYLFLGARRNLNERESGKYTCTSVRNKNMESFIYIFVTKAALFTSKGLETIHYIDKDDIIKVPCSLSEPRAIATLQKSQNGILNCPMNDSVRFYPKLGFLLNPKKLQQPQGTYLCIADFNNTFQIIKFNVVKEDSSNATNPDHASEDQHHEASEFESTQNPSSQSSTLRPTSPSSVGGTNSDCANVICGDKASCITNAKRDAVCKCNNGYFGNPYVECKHTSLTTTVITTTSSSSSSDPNDGVCSAPEDCPSDRTCIKHSCQDPCIVKPICGTNTYCNETVDHVPMCECREGFVGDPYSTQEGQKCEHPNCKHNVCGENTNCKYVNGIISCACKSGFSTHHDGVCRPNNKQYTNQLVQKPQFKPIIAPGSISSSEGGKGSSSGKKECYYDSDCLNDRMCIQDRCENPCVNACGLNALCHTRNHFPRCSCPEGTTGDPFYKCTSILSGGGGNWHSSSRPQPPLNIVGAEISNEKEVIDCGGQNPVCGPNTICQASRKYFVCACPSFYVGDPYSKEGCSRENGYEKCEQDSDCPHFLSCLRHQGCVNPCNVPNVCQPGRSCVPYSNRPACVQTANYNVERPRDDLAAAGNNEELELTEIPEGMNSSSCFVKSGDNLISPCGSNTYCFDVNGEAYCGCITNYVGDPYVGCEPLQPCKSKKECPANELCQDGFCKQNLETSEKSGNTTNSNPCSPSPCADPMENCVIIRTNNSALCIPPKDYLGRGSMNELQRRLGCVDENWEVIENGEEENDENYSTTEFAYYTVIPNTVSYLSSSSASISMEDKLLGYARNRADVINTSNESRPMPREELSVVDV